MARAYIEYLPADVDIKTDCKPTIEPTVEYQFFECQHCNKVYVAEKNPGEGEYGLKWYRVQRFTIGSRMFKRAKRAASEG